MAYPREEQRRLKLKGRPSGCVFKSCGGALGRSTGDKPLDCSEFKRLARDPSCHSNQDGCRPPWITAVKPTSAVRHRIRPGRFDADCPASKERLEKQLLLSGITRPDFLTMNDVFETTVIELTKDFVPTHEPRRPAARGGDFFGWLSVDRVVASQRAGVAVVNMYHCDFTHDVGVISYLLPATELHLR